MLHVRGRAPNIAVDPRTAGGDSHDRFEQTAPFFSTAARNAAWLAWPWILRNIGGLRACWARPPDVDPLRFNNLADINLSSSLASAVLAW